MKGSRAIGSAFFISMREYHAADFSSLPTKIRDSSGTDF